MNRFWSKVNKDGPIPAHKPELGQCWVWTAYCNAGGYGSFRLGGTMVLAHRVSYEIEFEKIPEGLFALHKCDNPPCVNPNHLYLGTHIENCKDKVAANRQARVSRPGMSSPLAKLTEKQVFEIRNLSAAGITRRWDYSKRDC